MIYRSIAAVIPAAGNSGRMGFDKAFLPIGHGMTFAGHLVSCFGLFGCKPVVLVVNEKFDSPLFHEENLVTVVNHHLDRGRSWSIHLGLNQVSEGFACFIQNIDNPFLEPDLLDKLIDSLSADGYVVPVHNGQGGHPILLGTNLVDFFRRQKDLNDFRQDLQRFTRIEVPYPDERILWNINTPGDYKEFAHWNRHSDKKL